MRDPYENRSCPAVRVDSAVRLAAWHGVGRRRDDYFLSEYRAGRNRSAVSHHLAGNTT